MKEIANILVVAPDQEQSGKSHAISIDKKISVTKIKETVNHTEYTCSGTPVDCVKIAIHKLLKKKPNEQKKL